MRLGIPPLKLELMLALDPPKSRLSVRALSALAGSLPLFPRVLATACAEASVGRGGGESGMLCYAMILYDMRSYDMLCYDML